MPSVIKEPCDEAVILSRKSAAPCAKEQERWILAATILASSMAFIDGTVVNVALPSLQRSLQATAIGVQWVVESYSLFLSALLLVGGSLGDHYGRRRIFLIGVTVFAIASAWCGIAPNINQLIIARAVQGIGGALLVPGSLAIISASFSEEKRGKAIGTWSGFSAITTAIGPVLGGWLVEHVSWRAVFYLNLPIAAAVILISLSHVPESRDRQSTGRIDTKGALLATIGLGGVVYGLIESSRAGFLEWRVLAGVRHGTDLIGSFRACRDACEVADVAVETVSVAEFFRHQHSHLAAVLRARRRPVFPDPQFDSSAGLFPDRSGRGAFAFCASHVCAVALVGRINCEVRSATAVAGWSNNSRGGLCVVFASRNGGRLLVGLFPRRGRAGTGYGNQCSSANNHDHEFGAAVAGGRGFRHQ